MRAVVCLLGFLPSMFAHASAQPLEDNSRCITLASLNSSIGVFGQIAELLDVSGERPARLVTTLEEIDTGQIATRKLEDFGFRPDRANVALVEYLNPDVADIDRLAIGDRVLFPQLEVYDGQSWQTYVPEAPIDGFVVAARVADQVAERARIQAQEINEQIFHVASQRHDPVLVSEVMMPLGAHVVEAAEGLTGWRDYNEFLADHSQRITDVSIARIALEELVISAEPAQQAFLPRIDSGRFWRGTNEKINITLNIFDRDRTPLHDHQVRYMAKGMRDTNCGLQHTLPFSAPSHEAFHRLDKAEFVFWVVDPESNAWSQPFDLNLRNFGSAHRMNIYVDW